MHHTLSGSHPACRHYGRAGGLLLKRHHTSGLPLRPAGAFVCGSCCAAPSVEEEYPGEYRTGDCMLYGAGADDILAFLMSKKLGISHES